MSLKIYVAGHKKFCPPFDATYVPIIGGMSTRENKDELADFIGDDTGDNISDLNNIFCELTVQYWIDRNRRLRCQLRGTSPCLSQKVRRSTDAKTSLRGSVWVSALSHSG